MSGTQESRSSIPVQFMTITESKRAADISSGDEQSTVYAQLENRLNAYQNQPHCTFSESTFTNEQNFTTWGLWLEGTGTLPAFPCESCEEFVTPDMEHLIGWQDCQSEMEVRDKTRFMCPSCGWLMPPEKRRSALQEVVAVHRGQKVVGGAVEGPEPQTSTLSFRVPASCNMFASEQELGVALWRMKGTENKIERMNLERTIRQGLFALPADDVVNVIDELSGMALMQRFGPCDIGICPQATTHLVAGIDTRKTVLHCAVTAFREGQGPVIIDWWSEPIEEGKLFDDAVMEAAERIRDKFRGGYPVVGGGTKTVDFESWDAGWRTNQIQAICDTSDFALPSMGMGAGVLQKSKFRRKQGAKIVGTDWQICNVQDRDLLEIDASAWKSRVFARLRLPANHADALTFARCDDAKLRWLVDHLTAEREIQSTKGGELITEFEQIRKENHLLDSVQMSLSGESVHLAIQELLAEQQPEEIDYEPVVYGGYENV